MKTGQLSFRVARPPAEVFAYLADLEHAVEWVPDLVSISKVTPGEVGVGTRYHEVVRMGKREGEAELEVTEYEPGRVFAHSGKGGPAIFSARFTLTPEGDETLVTHTYSVQLHGLARLMTPVIRGWVRKNTAQAVENLVRALQR